MARDSQAYTTADGSLDEQTRILHPLDSLMKRESETALGHLFQYWRHRCDGDRPPLEHGFNPREVMPDKLVSWVSWLDVTPDDPLNFVIHDHRGVTFPGLSDMRVRDVPNHSHMTACAGEYVRCKSFRQPIYHNIDQKIGLVARQYTRLAVPVADRKGRISKIFYACRMIFRGGKIRYVED